VYRLLANYKISVNPRYYAIAVFLFSACFVILLKGIIKLVGFEPVLMTDYVGIYEPVARNILYGKGITLNGDVIATHYPPGYSLLLSFIFGFSQVFGIGEQFIHELFIIINVALAATTLFLIARTIWSPILSLIPPFLWLTYPFVVWIISKPFSELPFMVALFIGFYLFWKGLIRERSTSKTHFFLSGVFMGIAMLIRPIGIGLGLILAIIPLVVARSKLQLSKRMLIPILILFGNLLVVLPWEMHVYSNEERIIILGDNNLSFIVYGMTFDLESENKTTEGVRQLMSRISSRENEMVSAKSAVKVLINEGKKYPSQLLGLIGTKLIRTWYGNNRIESVKFDLFSVVIQIIYLVPIIIGTIRVFHNKGPALTLAIGIWFIVVYFWLIIIIGIPMVRYMVPVMGLLFLLVPGIFSYNNKKMTLE
tara:strand:+ start:4460 stop:5728 length:1269 start_codon:yes stop_codon:yes gene_type:complete